MSHVKKLSAIKQRLSLGEVKKAEKQAKAQNRKIVRTTVVNTSDCDWPPITEEEEKEVIDRLKEDLKCLKRPITNVPLNEIRKVKKEERRDFRHKWLTQKYLEEGFNFTEYTRRRNYLLLGVNQISSAIEQAAVSAIIIEKGVDPQIITKLLVPLAESKKIPLIAITGLNTTCKEVFDTNCIALGFKENCGESENPFNNLFQLVVSISEKHRAPDNQSTGSDYFKPPKIRRV